jgi:ubiquinone biosynthesis protein
MKILRSIRVFVFVTIVAIDFSFHFKIRKRFIDEKSFTSKTNYKWKKLGLRTKKILLKLGGIYIKLGQFLSNLNHIFPQVFVEPLQELQDRVPAHPYSEIEKRLKMELGMNPLDFFESINPIPIASASTAQVHFGRWKGKDVAIKVLYPGIEESIDQDLRIIRMLMKMIHLLLIEFQYEEIFSQLKNLIHQEMDLSLERENMKEMKERFQGNNSIYIPKSMIDLPSHSILISEFIYGMKITDPRFLNQPLFKKTKIADHLIQAFITMVFRFRFFHADPHPGNIIIREDGSICLIDFGAVARISPREEESLVIILMSAMRNDYPGMIKGFSHLGILKPKTDLNKLLAIIEYSMLKMKRILTELDSYQNISLDVLDVDSDLKFLKEIQSSISELVADLNVPPNYIAMQRVLAQLVGNLVWIDPTKSIFDYAEKPFLEIVSHSQNWSIPWNHFWKNIEIFIDSTLDQFKKWLQKN